MSFIGFLWQRPSVRFLVALNFLINLWAFAEDLRETRTTSGALGAVCEIQASFSSSQDNDKCWVAKSRATATNSLESSVGPIDAPAVPFELPKTESCRRLSTSVPAPKYIDASLWGRGPPAQ